MTTPNDSFFWLTLGFVALCDSQKRQKRKLIQLLETSNCTELFLIWFHILHEPQILFVFVIFLIDYIFFWTLFFVSFVHSFIFIIEWLTWIVTRMKLKLIFFVKWVWSLWTWIFFRDLLSLSLLSLLTNSCCFFECWKLWICRFSSLRLFVLEVRVQIDWCNMCINIKMIFFLSFSFPFVFLFNQKQTSKWGNASETSQEWWMNRMNRKCILHAGCCWRWKKDLLVGRTPNCQMLWNDCQEYPSNHTQNNSLSFSLSVFYFD